MKNSKGPRIVSERPFLRVVDSHFSAEERLTDDALQFGLFPSASNNVLSFFHAGFFRGTKLVDVLSNIRPRIFFDFRAAPTFRNLEVSRQEVFSLMQALNADYIDVAGMIGKRRFEAAQLERGFFIEFVDEFVRFEQGKARPIMFIFDSLDFMSVSAGDILTKVSSTKGCDFRVEVFVGAKGWA